MPRADSLKSSAVRRVRLFRNGRNQALRIPREFEFAADEALLRREGDRLILEPLRPAGLLATLAHLAPLEVDFPDVDEGLDALDGVDI